MNIDRNLTARQGAVKAIIGILVLVVALIAGIALKGSLNQETQTSLLAKGYESFSAGKYDDAYKSFEEALKTFTFTLKVYRIFKGSENHMTRQELNELIVSTCLAAAHESFFELKPAKDWTEKAQKAVNDLPAGDRKSELEQLTKTASEISELCEDFAAGQFEKAFKQLKKVEQNALPSDQDFFIFEIRFLIALGKALKEPAILGRARELLFFATTDAGINNDKTQKLWGILTH
ncbi:MAG: hypothetical protein Kow0029_26130 [Candidatus Rifleibacteriota bacterium]